MTTYEPGQFVFNIHSDLWGLVVQQEGDNIWVQVGTGYLRTWPCVQVVRANHPLLGINTIRWNERVRPPLPRGARTDATATFGNMTSTTITFR